jgi:hypothetical protein
MPGGREEEVRDVSGLGIREFDLPGVGTRLIVNGNLFRIVYTRHGPVFRFTAEYQGKHEP